MNVENKKVHIANQSGKKKTGLVISSRTQLINSQLSKVCRQCIALNMQQISCGEILIL